MWWCVWDVGSVKKCLFEFFFLSVEERDLDEREEKKKGKTSFEVRTNALEEFLLFLSHKR